MWKARGAGGRRPLLSGDPKGILLAARAAQEIGADFVKTCYTGDPESFHMVVEGCPVPVVVLGDEKAETIEQVFSLVHASIQAGGKGIAIGRDIWEHGKTKAMVEAMVGMPGLALALWGSSRSSLCPGRARTQGCAGSLDARCTVSGWCR